MRKNIENRLRAWFKQMTAKYNWLRIKFEFSENRGVYLVSFSPVCKIELSDEFNREAMDFADQLNREFGNDAPLFTDEEKLFHLSANAEVIGETFTTAEKIVSHDTVIPTRSFPLTITWSDYKTSADAHDLAYHPVESTPEYNEYALAA